ncbi:MAG: hypothetical protein J0H64_07575, partial [Actinobacteria bacterium]|nr:hypothetical protein [Actinomycetota bacterium]
MHGQPPRGRILPGLIPDSLRVYARQWWRFLLAQLLCLLGLTVLIGAVASAVQSSLPGFIAFLESDVRQLDARIAVVASALTLGVVLVSLPFLVAVLAAIVTLTASAVSGARMGLWRALGRGFARFLPVLGALSLAVGAVLVTFVLAPFLVLLGLAGFAVCGVRSLWLRSALARARASRGEGAAAQPAIPARFALLGRA